MKYKAKHVQEAQGFAEMGYTNTEIAKSIGIGESTLYAWQNQHPEFQAAIEAGKRPTDIKVEQSLLRRALGTTYTETTEIDGKTTKTVTKTALPDVTAQIFWLKNRDRDNWRDKYALETDTGPTTIKVLLPLGDFDGDENIPEERLALYNRLREARDDIKSAQDDEARAANDSELLQMVTNAEHAAEHPNTGARERLADKIEQLNKRTETKPKEAKKDVADKESQGKTEASQQRGND